MPSYNPLSGGSANTGKKPIKYDPLSGGSANTGLPPVGQTKSRSKAGVSPAAPAPVGAPTQPKYSPLSGGSATTGVPLRRTSTPVAPRPADEFATQLGDWDAMRARMQIRSSTPTLSRYDPLSGARTGDTIGTVYSPNRSQQTLAALRGKTPALIQLADVVKMPPVGVVGVKAPTGPTGLGGAGTISAATVASKIALIPDKKSTVLPAEFTGADALVWWATPGLAGTHAQIAAQRAVTKITEDQPQGWSWDRIGRIFAEEGKNIVKNYQAIFGPQREMALASERGPEIIAGKIAASLGLVGAVPSVGKQVVTTTPQGYFLGNVLWGAVSVLNAYDDYVMSTPIEKAPFALPKLVDPARVEGLKGVTIGESLLVLSSSINDMYLATNAAYRNLIVTDPATGKQKGPGWSPEQWPSIITAGLNKYQQAYAYRWAEAKQPILDRITVAVAAADKKTQQALAEQAPLTVLNWDPDVQVRLLNEVATAGNNSFQMEEEAYAAYKAANEYLQEHLGSVSRAEDKEVYNAMMVEAASKLGKANALRDKNPVDRVMESITGTQMILSIVQPSIFDAIGGVVAIAGLAPAARRLGQAVQEAGLTDLAKLTPVAAEETRFASELEHIGELAKVAARKANDPTLWDKTVNAVANLTDPGATRASLEAQEFVTSVAVWLANVDTTHDAMKIIEAMKGDVVNFARGLVGPWTSRGMNVLTNDGQIAARIATGPLSNPKVLEAQQTFKKIADEFMVSSKGLNTTSGIIDKQVVIQELKDAMEVAGWRKYKVATAFDSLPIGVVKIDVLDTPTGSWVRYLDGNGEELSRWNATPIQPQIARGKAAELQKIIKPSSKIAPKRSPAYLFATFRRSIASPLYLGFNTGNLNYNILNALTNAFTDGANIFSADTFWKFRKGSIEEHFTSIFGAGKVTFRDISPYATETGFTIGDLGEI